MQTSFKHTGHFIYENNQLAYILTPEGRALPDGNGGFQYQYYLKDHLGNTRILFDENKTVLQNYSYYPFGMEQNGLNYTNTSTLKNNYLYNGKELQDDFGLGWYDYGARFYEPSLSRTTAIDSHAENFYSESLYSFFGNNPINNIDPTGMDWYTSKDGSATMWKKGSADIEGYNNIGATFTQNIGNGVSVTYTQNEATSITTHTMNSDQWVSQYSKTDWDGTPASKACNKACDAMLASDGNSSIGMTVVVDIAGDGRAGNANGNAANAISDMSKALDADKPTKVNVDFRSGTGSADKMGDHFIVVEGKTEQLSKGKVTSTSFHFFDPGTSHSSKGTSSSNVLKVNNNRLEGTHINNGKTIVVTSIRPTN